MKIARFIITGKNKGVNKADLSKIIAHVKTMMSGERDEMKKQCYAEVGLLLNRVYLELRNERKQATYGWLRKE